jgi:DNA-binding transcriptional regulator YdaS (Cro superfamily)
MDIRAYLDKHNLSQKQFADLIGVSQGAVWQWLHGLSKVSPKHFEIIEKRTHGEVTREDIRRDLYRARRRNGEARAA